MNEEIAFLKQKAIPRSMRSPHSCSIKIPTLSVPRCGTVENGMTEDDALKAGMDEKSKEFVEAGAEVYATAS